MNTEITITAIVCASILAISITAMVQDFKLKKEKIKADTMIKAEEVKAQNQLEIEKLMLQNNQKFNQRSSIYDEDSLSDTRSKNKEKL